MAETFDGYHKWLGIPPAEQPPHHYRLLGLSLYESDPDVIEIAADQRMALLRSFHAGPHSDLTQKLLNEVAAARLTLLKPERRASYNDSLRRRLEKAQRGDQPAKPQQQSPTAERPPIAEPPPIAKPTAIVEPPPIEEPKESVTQYYEQLRRHVEQDKAPRVEPARTPRTSADELLETLAPVESPSSLLTELVTPVRPIKSAPPRTPVAAPPELSETAPIDAPPSVARDPEHGRTPKREEKPAPRSEPTRGITLPPRSAAWDEAIEEACAAESELSHPRQGGWKVSPAFVQLVVGVFIIAALLYGGIKGFTLWQNAEARRTAVAKHDARPSLSPHDIEPEAPAIDMQPAHTETPPTHTDTAITQPVPSEPNDPSLKGARSVAGGFGLPPAPSPAPPTEASSSSEQPRPIVRNPIPTGEARRKSTEAASDVVKTESRRISTAAGQSELAHKLAEKADKTADDPATRYALATRALELAVRLCDVHLASDLVGGFSTYYDLDSWALRAKTLQRLAQNAPNRETREIIAEAAFNLVEPALADDHYDSALELATMSMNLAAALRNFTLRDQAREAVDRLKQIPRWQKSVEEAKYRLETNPSDNEANLVLGEFKSLMKHDWQGGLALLRAANDKELCTLVEREQAPPGPWTDQAALADAWWGLASARQEEAKPFALKAMRTRAVHWYREALPGLSGDELAVAKRRIETL
jgi:hypothetical protein